MLLVFFAAGAGCGGGNSSSGSSTKTGATARRHIHRYGHRNQWKSVAADKSLDRRGVWGGHSCPPPLQLVLS